MFVSLTTTLLVSSEILSYTFPTSQLKVFLSDDWLNSDSMDAGIEAIRDHIELSPELAGRGGSRNSIDVHGVHSAQTKSQWSEPPATLESVANRIRKGGLSNFYLPENVNQNHWFWLEVDIAAKGRVKRHNLLMGRRQEARKRRK